MDSKLKTLIVEDDKQSSAYLLNRLKKLCPEIGIIEQRYSLISAFECIVSNIFDLVFFDINMPEGTIFELMDRLDKAKKNNFEIIIINRLFD